MLEKAQQSTNDVYNIYQNAKQRQRKQKNNLPLLTCSTTNQQAYHELESWVLVVNVMHTLPYLGITVLGSSSSDLSPELGSWS